MKPVPDADAERAAAFIRANLSLREVPGTGLRLHLAGPRSGLSRLVPPGGTPYWAHAWPGGVALALHLAAHPETVRGRTVFEIGTGSGLVALAALKAGALSAVGFDPDPLSEVAARVNAEANDISPFRVLPPEALAADLGALAKAHGQSVLFAGDVFYDGELAAFTTSALDGAGAVLGPDASIFVGDIGRRFLPRDRLEPLAAYPVRDVGDPQQAPLREGWVFRWTCRG